MATERRAVNIETGYTSPTAPSDRPLSTSGLKTFASAAAYAAFVGRAAAAGDEYWDTTLGVRRTHNGVLWIAHGIDGGAISESTMNLADNQVAAADVTGLLLDKTLWRSALIEVDISRRDTATPGSELRWVGTLRALHTKEDDAWALAVISGGPDSVNGKPGGVTFSITAAGQVQYTSHDLAGAAYVGKLTFSARMKSQF
jgi:hypothetical protein